MAEAITEILHFMEPSLFFIVIWFSVATSRQVAALLQPFKSTAFEQYNQQTRYELQNTRQFNYYQVTELLTVFKLAMCSSYNNLSFI